MSGNNRQPVDVFSAPVAGMVQTGSGTNEYARLDRGSRNTVLALMGYDSPDDTSTDRVGRSVLKRERREVDQVRKRRPDRPESEAVTSDPSPAHCQQIPSDICTEILHGTIDRLQHSYGFIRQTGPSSNRWFFHFSDVITAGDGQVVGLTKDTAVEFRIQQDARTHKFRATDVRPEHKAAFATTRGSPHLPLPNNIAPTIGRGSQQITSPDLVFPDARTLREALRNLGTLNVSIKFGMLTSALPLLLILCLHTKISHACEDYKLDPNIFRSALRSFALPTPTRDLFASHLNTQVPIYFDKVTDAFKQPWRPGVMWANPPFSQLPAVLQKIKEERPSLLLLLPNWGGQLTQSFLEMVQIVCI